MKKLLLIFLIIILSTQIAFSYDEEDDITSLEWLTGLQYTIFDLGVISPLDAYAAGIDAKFGVLLSNKFTLGIKTEFFNNLTQTVHLDNKQYAYDGTGTVSYMQFHKVDDHYTWEDIDNELEVFLGWNMSDTVGFAFMLGGGTDFDLLEVIIDSYTFEYSSAGLLQVILNDTDKQISGKKISGKGIVSCGFGFNINGDELQSDLISALTGSTTITFNVGGKGDAENLVTLDGTGIVESGFDGDGNAFSEHDIRYQDNTNYVKRVEYIHTEDFSYFDFINEGHFEVGLDFQNYFYKLSRFSRFRFSPGFGYKVGLRHYTSAQDAKDTRFFSSFDGIHQNGDLQYGITNYNFNYNLFIGATIPLYLDIRPLSEVQFRLNYELDCEVNLQKYSANYSEVHSVAGVDQSFYDPVVNCNQSLIDFRHEFGVRFRYEFPKMVRLTVGTEYILFHTLYNNKIFINDNTRRYVNGSTGIGPFAHIEDIANYQAIDNRSAGLTTSILQQTVDPYLELDFEFAKGFSTLSFKWKPSFGIGNSADSHILNLANWEITNVIKINPSLIHQNKTGRKGFSKKDTVNTLVILHTNDTHGHPLAFDNYPVKNVGGLPARANFVKSMRGLYQNVLVLDAGDINTGRPESNMFTAEPDIIGYNYIGYDAMTIGNHEFDISQDDLKAQMKQAEFPFLSANIKTEKGDYFATPYIIKSYKNFKVAIFGITTKETFTQGNKDNMKGLVFEDEVTVAKQMVEILSEKADIIIALTHCGIYDTNERGSRKIAKEVSGIDLIIDGHSHSALSEPVMENNVPIIQAWRWGMIMGKAVITIKNREFAGIDWTPVPINYKKVAIFEDGSKETELYGNEYTEDLTLLTQLETYNDLVSVELAAIIGRAGSLFSSLDIRKKEIALGNLVADSMLWAGKEYNADFAIQNGGGIRADIPQGSITKRIIYEVLPFDNSVVLVTLSGKEVKALFDYIARIPEGDGAFPHFSEGISCTINYSTKTSENIIINGKPLDPDKNYRIATNSFIAQGGDGYTMFLNALETYETSRYQRDVLIDYIEFLNTVLMPEIKNRLKKIGGKFSYSSPFSVNDNLRIAS